MTVNGSRIAVRRSGARRRRLRLPGRNEAPLTAEAVWAALSARPASERPALLRGYLGQLSAEETARLLALSEAAARYDVFARLARRDEAWQ